MIAAFIRKLVRDRRSRPAERRGSRRHAPEQVAPCVLVPEGGDKVPARIHNLSLRGAGVLVDRPFTPGTRVHLFLVNDGHTYALSLPFVIARCNPLNSRLFVLGGRFTRTLNLEELTPFLV